MGGFVYLLWNAVKMNDSNGLPVLLCHESIQWSALRPTEILYRAQTVVFVSDRSLRSWEMI